MLFSRLDDNVLELGANNLFFAFSDSLFICRLEDLALSLILVAMLYI